MMKKQLHFKLWFLFLLLSALGTKTGWSQATDTTGFFNPALTDRHLVYAEVVLVDADEDGNFDASFNLSQDTIATWGDYSTSLAFYDEGFQIRNGGGFTNTNVIVPVAGEVIKIWTAVDVPAKTYQTYVQLGDMPEPELVFVGDAGFRNTDITAINRWSCLHNPDAEPDYVTVNEVSIQTDSDPTLKSLTANVGVLDPAFDPLTLDYELAVPFGTTAVDFDAVAKGLGAKIEYFDGLGNPFPDDGVVPFSGDGVDVEIKVTALDGTELSYIVAIFVDEGSSDPTLSAIDLSVGAVDPAFNRDSTEYTVLVPAGTSSVEVTGIPNYPEATVAGNGTATLTNGSATVTLDVTSKDGTENKSYTVNIMEADGMNYAISLPGEDGNSSSIDVSGINLTTLPFTIEMWIKPDGDQNPNSGLLFMRNAENTDNSNIGLEYASNWQQSGGGGYPDRIRFINTDFGGTDYGTVSADVPENEWLHVAARLTENTRSIIIDGIETTSEGSYPAIDFTGGKLYIGWDSDNSARAFRGLVDEVRVWSDSIPTEELIQNKFDVLTGNEDNLVAYWNFDLPNSAQAVDMSGNKGHGIIAGGTYVESFSRVNLELSSLTVDLGALKPDFAPGITDFYVTLPKGTTSFTVNAVASNDQATITGSGTVNITNQKDSAIINVSADGESRDYKVHYVIDTDLTLKHSYTFADGTAKDIVSGADGQIQGGVVSEGVFTSSVEGDYITLPAGEIAINTYPSFTMEAYVAQGMNAGFSMLAYFGGLSGSNAAWMQISRTDEMSRGQLGTDGVAVNVSGAEPAAGEIHHYVYTVNNDSMIWYVDGTPVDTAYMTPNSIIGMLNTENAWLGYGGWNDPTWLGSLYEFNIYTGVMTPDQVEDRFVLWPMDQITADATLSDLMIDGVSIEGFAPYVLDYNDTLDVSVTTPPTVTATATNSNATVTITDAASLPGTATIVVTSEDGNNVNTYTVYFDYVTGIRDIISSSINVYPTISNGNFTVQTRIPSSVISVYDFAGKLITSKVSTSSEEKISVPGKGMYVMKVETEGVSKVFKVFKTN